MTEDRYVQAATHIFALLSAAGFEIGGEDQLAALQAKYPSESEDREGAKRLVSDWDNLLADLQIRSGTLLKTDSVSFLLGAGASKDCGGPLIGTIPLARISHRDHGKGLPPVV